VKEIPGIEISTNEKSKRIINIKLKEESLDKLIFPFHKFDITALEYKPFTRFTLAKSLDELFSNELSKLIHSVLTDRNTGCLLIIPAIVNKKFNDVFLVKLATGLAHLIGIPNFDHMSSKYYARFFVKHGANGNANLTSCLLSEKALQNRGFLNFVGLQGYCFGGDAKSGVKPSFCNCPFKFFGISVITVR